MKRAMAREQDLSTKMKEESYFRDVLNKIDIDGELPDSKQLENLDKSINAAIEIPSRTIQAILLEEKQQV